MSSAAAMHDRESGAGGGADEGGVLGRSRAITHDRNRNLGSLRATDSPRSGVGSGSDGGVGSGGSANGMNSSWKKKGASGNGTTSAGGVPSDLVMANIKSRDAALNDGSVPTARGAFSLSAIQARPDGREDASARTRLLLMDHNAPVPPNSGSVWSRLF